MAITGMIVEVRNNADAEVLDSLAWMPQISVYGLKDHQIVAVVEGDTVGSVNNVVRRILSFDGVINVYPVSVSEDD